MNVATPVRFISLLVLAFGCTRRHSYLGVVNEAAFWLVFSPCLGLYLRDEVHNMEGGAELEDLIPIPTTAGCSVGIFSETSGHHQDIKWNFPVNFVSFHDVSNK